MPGNYFNIKGRTESLTSVEIAADLLVAGSGIIYNDPAAPTGGSISYANGLNTSVTVSLSVNDGVDSDSGINTATRTVQRRSAVLSEKIVELLAVSRLSARQGVTPALPATLVLAIAININI